jgi:hypothetical protein
MTAGSLAQFLAAPFSRVLNMTGNNRLQLFWDLDRLSCHSIGIGIPLAMTPFS